MGLLFPECVAKGSRFTFGVLGVDLCSRDFGVPNRPQPFATVPSTVLNRPSATVVGAKLPWPMGKSRKNVTFLTCEKLWSCRFAWLAWHFVAFQHVSRRVKKPFCVASAIFFATFSEDVLHIPWQAWHFVTCHENRRRLRTKRRFCSRSIRKTGRKTLILTRRSVEEAVPIGKVAKTYLFRRVTQCAHVVLRGRRGTL